jgi:hypothetical protein
MLSGFADLSQLRMFSKSSGNGSRSFTKNRSSVAPGSGAGVNANAGDTLALGLSSWPFAGVLRGFSCSRLDLVGVRREDGFTAKRRLSSFISIRLLVYMVCINRLRFVKVKNRVKNRVKSGVKVGFPKLG